MSRRKVASSGMRTFVQANSERKLRAADVKINMSVEWNGQIWQTWSPGPTGWWLKRVTGHKPDGTEIVETVDAPTSQLLRAPRPGTIPMRGAGA